MFRREYEMAMIVMASPRLRRGNPEHEAGSMISGLPRGKNAAR